MVRIGLDVGGTFTDVVAVDQDSGATSWLKVPTNVDDPSKGVLDAIEATGNNYRELSAIRLGTTLGVNALLTHSGAPTGLITTAGFRDVLEIRRTHRKALFDLNERFPKPLVPRHLRLEVDERIDSDGRIVRPLDEEGVRAAWRRLRDAGVTAVAIVFLFSFENPAHEQRAKEIVVEEGGASDVFISYDVLPAYREYERTSTTVAAARIAGTVERYVQQLELALAERGVGTGRLSIMTNSGGALPARAIGKLPISTLLSGPVGGVEAARWLAAQAGWDNVVTLDMGGTSCDVSGIVDGVADERLDMEIGGHAISYPTYDIETIGAGGGSIGWIDSGGTLRVGPQSAGSQPGPACYGRGGTRPTVTDANLVLGRYDANAALGGSVRLDVGAARAAIERDIARPLGLSIEGAAAGMLRIVNVLMTNAVRVISVERGRDVREFMLVAYGGAGPAHAAEIARELAIERVLVPPFPGCTSAFGGVISGTRRDFVRTVGRRIDRLNLGSVQDLNQELRQQADAALAEEHFSAEDRTLQTWLDLRYAGQAHELSIEHAHTDIGEGSLSETVNGFHALHRQLYGHAFSDVPVELVNVRVKGLGRRSEVDMWWDWQKEAVGARELDDVRPVYFEETSGFVESAVLLREDVAASEPIDGPAVIHQLDSTVLVPPSFAAEVLPSGSMVLHLKRGPTDRTASPEPAAEAAR